MILAAARAPVLTMPNCADTRRRLMRTSSPYRKLKIRLLLSGCSIQPCMMW